MYVDHLNTFAWETALNTGAAGTYLLGDQIPLNTVRDIGVGKPLWWVGVVTTAATSGGSATGQFQLASDATAAIDTGGSASIHLSSPVFAVANMTAGTKLFQIAVPQFGAVPYELFLGVLQVTGVAAFTAGAISTFITENPDAWRAYPNGTV